MEVSWPESAAGGPADHSGLTPTGSADLALSPLVNKALFHPALHYVVFLGKSNSERQLAEVLELLLLLIGSRCHLLNTTPDRTEMEKSQL